MLGAGVGLGGRRSGGPLLWGFEASFGVLCCVVVGRVGKDYDIWWLSIRFD